MVILYFGALAVSFAVLFKCADYFVDGASGIARVMNIPKMVVGVVLVGLSTTAPEFGVSVQASYLGHPEISLGNAIGSVIADDGIALALAAVLAPAAIFVNCRLLKIFSVFLLSIDFLAYFLARNGRIGRMEGLFFILILIVYFVLLLRQRNLSLAGETSGNLSPENAEAPSSSKWSRTKKHILQFAIGIAGVLLTSRVVIWAAIAIAKHFSISETVIGLTVVAVGTSLPEISTCITAAFKGEGEIAVGDIIGADILNVLWIIGVSAVVNPIQVDVDVINFTFPYMILVVFVMLVSLRIGCRIGKAKGILLIILYLLYVFLTLKLFV